MENEKPDRTVDEAEARKASNYRSFPPDVPPPPYDGVKELVDDLIVKATVPRLKAEVVTPRAVAKAVVFHALAWGIVAFDKVSKITRKLVAVTSGVIHEATKEPPPPFSTRDWDFPIGPISGKAGERKEIIIEPQSPFMVEKIMATDTGDGLHTALMQILIGDRLQRPATNDGTLTLFYKQNTLGNGIRTDWCRLGQKMVIQIKFLQDATYEGCLWGKAAILDGAPF